MKTREVRTKSVIPLYGAAGVWALYCLFFPLYEPAHFITLAMAGLVAYVLLDKAIPGKVETVEVPEEPVTTGNAEADALIAEGKAAVAEMARAKNSLGPCAVSEKISQLITVTEKIFADIEVDQNDVPQVKRFAGYYLPTTLKLLKSYEHMSSQGIEGENITATLGRIENILDTTITAYKKQLDALFQDQALDIDTDITVLESMLKREGLGGKDFDVNK